MLETITETLKKIEMLRKLRIGGYYDLNDIKEIKMGHNMGVGIKNNGDVVIWGDYKSSTLTHLAENQNKTLQNIRDISVGLFAGFSI